MLITIYEVGTAIFTSQMNKRKFTIVKLLAQSNTTRLLGARAGSLIPAPWALSLSLESSMIALKVVSPAPEIVHGKQQVPLNY